MPAAQLLLVLGLAVGSLACFHLRTEKALAEEENLRALSTPRCELPGLAIAPPSPWYSVPIESGEQGVEGCQMIWEEGDQYMGIMRLVAFDLLDRPEQLADWENFIIAFESMIMARMGITVGEPVWKKGTVPINGDAFFNGRAIALKATLQGVSHQNEVHIILFESATHKYGISMLTPSKADSAEVYAANTGAMAAVTQSIQPD